MRPKKALFVLAAAGFLSATSVAWPFVPSEGDRKEFYGGYVKPCSLDGVNPAYHPGIFGNPAIARFYYGFYVGPDRRWHVIPNCHIYP
jgi:hypothetical protein